MSSPSDVRQYGICAAAVLVCVARAAAGVDALYATSWSQPHTLFRIENYGTNPTVVEIGPTPNFTDIAVDPANSTTAYAITPSQVYTVDLTTGNVGVVGPYGVSHLNALDFAPDGTLYAWGSGSGFLYEINTITGAANGLFDTGFSSVGDLAYDPTTGKLFGAAAFEELVLIDPAAESAVSIGNHGIGELFGLDIDIFGNLYGGTNGGDVWRLDKSNASATFVGNMGMSVAGWSFALVPAPGAIALVAVAGLIRPRRRQRPAAMH